MSDLSFAIDIHNNPEVLKVIKDSIPYLPNRWHINKNAQPTNKVIQTYPNQTARYYIFTFYDREFAWLHTDDERQKVNKDYNVNQVRNVADASALMDHIYDCDQSGKIYNSEDGRWKTSVF